MWAETEHPGQIRGRISQWGASFNIGKGNGECQLIHIFKKKKKKERKRKNKLAYFYIMVSSLELIMEASGQARASNGL